MTKKRLQELVSEVFDEYANGVFNFDPDPQEQEALIAMKKVVKDVIYHTQKTALDALIKRSHLTDYVE